MFHPQPKASLWIGLWSTRKERSGVSRAELSLASYSEPWSAELTGLRFLHPEFTSCLTLSSSLPVLAFTMILALFLPGS